MLIALAQTPTPKVKSAEVELASVVTLHSEGRWTRRLFQRFRARPGGPRCAVYRGAYDIAAVSARTLAGRGNLLWRDAWSQGARNRYFEIRIR